MTGLVAVLADNQGLAMACCHPLHPPGFPFRGRVFKRQEASHVSLAVVFPRIQDWATARVRRGQGATAGGCAAPPEGAASLGARDCPSAAGWPAGGGGAGTRRRAAAARAREDPAQRLPPRHCAATAGPRPRPTTGGPPAGERSGAGAATARPPVGSAILVMLYLKQVTQKL